MRLFLIAAVSALSLAACMPPAAEQSSTPTIEMSDNTRAQMAEINAAWRDARRRR